VRKGEAALAWETVRKLEEYDAQVGEYRRAVGKGDGDGDGRGGEDGGERERVSYDASRDPRLRR